MKRKRKNQKRERAVMLCSSVLVLTALTMTGIYVKEKNQAQDDGYVVDLSQLEPQPVEPVVIPEETPEDSQTVSSSKVENKESLWEKDYFEWFPENYDFIEENTEEIKEDDIFDFFAKAEELIFSEEEQLLWPVVGNVLINYSMEKPVYFSTLEQYKLSPAIVIQAEEGQNVLAAARGRITEIKKTEELGNVITMELGNGYEIICGQLTNIQIKEGDVVEKGQYIADVAGATKYYSVEGDNIYFALKKNGEPVNPMTKLQ